MTNNEELKPCPFCGSNVSVFCSLSLDGYYIECELCSNRFGFINDKGIYDSENEVVEYWNDREYADQKIAAWNKREGETE